MIQFLGVTKKYKRFPRPIVALDNVSFEINEGEFVFLVGASGSGKTSILRHIIREETPTSGRIFFYDEDITKLKQSGIYKLRRQIGTVFQDYKLIEEKTAYENVAFAMEAAGAKKKEIEETVPYLLEIVNLVDRGEAFPRQLSGGEKQRVAIARAMANNPKVLIADEPTGNLDPEAAWDVVQVLDKINKWGTTIIMSTHGSEIVNSLQKRVIRMENGKLVRDDKKGKYDVGDKYSLSDKADLKDVKEEKSTKKESSDEEKLDETEKETELEKSDIKADLDKSVTTDNIIILPEPSDRKEEIKISEVTPQEPIASTAEVETPQESAVKEVLREAEVYGISALKLGKKLEDKLVEEGYKDVEDILTDGIAKVNDKLNASEVKQLAKSIKKFLTTE